MIGQRNFEVRFLEGKVRRLEREIAKLREQGERLLDKTLELGTNNAKLRELVRYAYECAIHSDHATCDDCRRMNGYCILEQRMSELGVPGTEVNDG